VGGEPFDTVYYVTTALGCELACAEPAPVVPSP
jgi:hypothetical protein